MEHEFFRPDNELSVFHNVRFYGHPTLSEVIKTLNWGSNRDIKQKGFRIVPIESKPGIIKSWPRKTDPSFEIVDTSYITSKGQSVAVIHVPEKAEEVSEKDA